jgi:hypothetical protein
MKKFMTTFHGDFYISSNNPPHITYIYLDFRSKQNEGTTYRNSVIVSWRYTKDESSRFNVVPLPISDVLGRIRDYNWKLVYRDYTYGEKTTRKVSKPKRHSWPG